MVKKREGRICQECVELIYDTDYLNWYLNEKSSLIHSSIMCDKCVKKQKVPQRLLTPFNKYKAKSNFVEGTPTKTGTRRFYFKSEKGKIIQLTSESGIKRKLNPAKKNEI